MGKELDPTVKHCLWTRELMVGNAIGRARSTIWVGVQDSRTRSGEVIVSL